MNSLESRSNCPEVQLGEEENEIGSAGKDKKDELFFSKNINEKKLLIRVRTKDFKSVPNAKVYIIFSR